MKPDNQYISWATILMQHLRAITMEQGRLDSQQGRVSRAAGPMECTGPKFWSPPARFESDTGRLKPCDLFPCPDSGTRGHRPWPLHPGPAASVCLPRYQKWKHNTEDSMGGQGPASRHAALKWELQFQLTPNQKTAHLASACRLSGSIHPGRTQGTDQG